ncbi:MAG: aspartate carbamoyltransferase regulatory subunit [Lachnospiraceae bacterium]|nr:aspartate carbamoyltransferase regulatory subunit [Lachnospiraceae bacterium]
MKIDSIKNGIVLDHIKAGNSMKIYNALGLANMECSVAVLQRVPSKKMGKKDILKIADYFDIDFDVIGYMDPDVSVVIIRDGEIVEKKKVELPEKITNVVKCINPRCITSIEQELDHVFVLSDREERVYRCQYCEAKQSKYIKRK